MTGSKKFNQIHKFVRHLNYKNNTLYNIKIKEKISKTGILKFVIFPYIYIANISNFLFKILAKNNISKFVFGLVILIYESGLNEKDFKFSDNADPKFENKEDKVYDVIVIGSGPGGSVAIDKILEKYKNVLLIEKGGKYEPSSIEHHSFKQTYLQFKNEGMNFSLGNVPMIFAEGSTLGGGSEVNSGLYFELTEPYKSEILNLSNINEKDWDAAEDEVKRYLSVQNDPNFDIDSSKSALHLGSLKKGLTSQEIPRWKKYKPVAEHQSMQATYLKNAFEKGLDLILRQRVVKIDNQNSKFIKVLALDDWNNKFTYKCRKVIVSAGTIETPKILKNSNLIKSKVRFNFHPMHRVVAENKNEINRGDLFPSIQSWTGDKEFKFGYSVSTYPYIKATLASLGGNKDGLDFKSLACYFSSTVLKYSNGRIFYFKDYDIPFIYIKKKDRVRLKKGFDMLHKILSEGGATNIWPESSTKLAPMTTVHVFGSLPISISKDIGKYGELVCDPRIKISDGSILPLAPWGNPQAVIMVLNLILIKEWLNKYE